MVVLGGGGLFLMSEVLLYSRMEDFQARTGWVGQKAGSSGGEMKEGWRSALDV